MISTYKYKFSTFALLALLGGCGGGGSGDTGTPNTPDSTGAPNNLTTTGEPVLAGAKSIVDGTAVGTPNPNWPDGATASNAASASGLSCGAPGEGSAYTYTHLNVFIDGVQQQLPANVGWVNPPNGSTGTYTCAFPLHTDDNSGKIRFASGGSYTLGQFFAVWGQPLSSTNVAGLTRKPISVYVNDGGRQTKYTGDLSKLALSPKRDISIVVGDTKPAQIPNYAWTEPAPLDPIPIELKTGESVGTAVYPVGDTQNGGQGQPVDGLTCGGMGTDYHVHTHVAIIRNQVQLSLPAGIGIVPPTGGTPCYYPTHVHDGTGVVHVEAGSYQLMTLGQLFDIWGMPLSATQAADSGGAPVMFYINDGNDLRQYTGDPRNIELLSRRSITIVIGSGVQTIPSYNWLTYNEPH